MRTDNRYITAVTRDCCFTYLRGSACPSKHVRKPRKVGRRILRKAIEQLPLLIIHYKHHLPIDHATVSPA
jgi:hypothetical protein